MKIFKFYGDRSTFWTSWKQDQKHDRRNFERFDPNDRGQMFAKLLEKFAKSFATLFFCG